MILFRNSRILVIEGRREAISGNSKFILRNFRRNFK